jgi:hypothetical protein
VSGRETAWLRKEIREKLQKFLAKIPVFMYVTDFRAEALKHVIESLDTTLFERVTGLTIKDFRLLNRLGLFNAQEHERRDLPVPGLREGEPSLRRRTHGGARRAGRFVGPHDQRERTGAPRRRVDMSAGAPWRTNTSSSGPTRRSFIGEIGY